MCYCKWCEAFLALVIIILAWPGFIVWNYSSWVIIISAILILAHELFCKECGGICCKAPSKKRGR